MFSPMIFLSLELEKLMIPELSNSQMVSSQLMVLLNNLMLQPWGIASYHGIILTYLTLIRSCLFVQQSIVACQSKRRHAHVTDKEIGGILANLKPDIYIPIFTPLRPDPQIPSRLRHVDYLLIKPNLHRVKTTTAAKMSIAVVSLSIVCLVAWKQWLNERAILAKEIEEVEQQLMELGDAEPEFTFAWESRNE